MSYIHVVFKIKNCLNDDLFISCDDRIGKNVAEHLHICSGYVTQVSDPWPVGLLFSDQFCCLSECVNNLVCYSRFFV